MAAFTNPLLYEVLACRPAFPELSWAARLKPSKYGCLIAYCGVMRFYGSKVIILFIRSIALSLALGISWLSDVGTNLGKVKPILAASW